jgi:dUTP pyrophosphatase
MKIKIQKVHQNSVVPKYATDGSAAFDLHVCLDHEIYLNPGECKILTTGLKFEFSKEYAALILPRSGLGAKQGIVLGNLLGLCDSDFRGTYGITAWNRNHDGEAFKISNGDRLAQCMIVPVIHGDFEIVEELSETVRNTGGFGSTGV